MDERVKHLQETETSQVTYLEGNQVTALRITVTWMTENLHHSFLYENADHLLRSVIVLTTIS